MVEEAEGYVVYSGLIDAELERAEARKASIEQRGLAVITTAATLVTLLFALAAVVTGATEFVLPSSARHRLDQALISLFVAGVAALGTNFPLIYKGVRPYNRNAKVRKWKLPDKKSKRGLEWLVREKWGESSRIASRRTAVTRLALLQSAKRLNNIKGWFLFAAVCAEVVGLVFVALAVRIILQEA